MRFKTFVINIFSKRGKSIENHILRLFFLEFLDYFLFSIFNLVI